MTATADHFVRGVRRHQAGALADAEGAYRAVLDADPRHHEALRLLGLLCARDGRPNEAMALVQRAIEATDQPGLAWHARGQLDIDAGRLDDAATAFAQATVTLPTFVRAWVDLALVRERQGRLDEAADAWAEAARREPNEPDHHLMRGTVLAHLGRHVDAIESLERATALAPESAIAWSALGAVLRRVDRWDDALSALRRANALDPERAETAVTLIDALLDRREIRVATAEARRALEHWPHDASVHHVAARTLECAAELEMAESHLRIAIDLDPRAVDARVSLADLLARTDRIDEADRAYRDAIRRQPDHADAWSGRLRIAAASRSGPEVVAFADALAARFPEDPVVALAVAAQHRRHGREDDARTRLVSIVEESTSTTTARRVAAFELAALEDHAGRYDDAWRAATIGNRLKRAAYDRDGAADLASRCMARYDAAHVRTMPRASIRGRRPIFIVGLPRSGSSLVEQILAAHSQVGALGESDVIGRAIGRVESMLGRAGRFPDHLGGVTASDLDRLASFIDEVVGSSGDDPVVVEKTLTNDVMIGFIAQVCPAARIVWCRRDPLDTCVSCWFHDFTGHHPYVYDLDDLAWAHGRHERLMVHWRDVAALPLLEVRYEDVVRRPRETIGGLLDFCGVPWEASCLSFHASDRTVRTASAEQVRRPLYGSSIGRHRHYASHLGPLRAGLSEAG